MRVGGAACPQSSRTSMPSSWRRSRSASISSESSPSSSTTPLSADSSTQPCSWPWWSRSSSVIGAGLPTGAREDAGGFPILTAGRLLGGLARGLDHAHLALGALGDVADRVGDLAEAAAGLLGGRRHLLRGRRDGVGVARDLADQRAELAAHVVVRVDRRASTYSCR